MLQVRLLRFSVLFWLWAAGSCAAESDERAIGGSQFRCDRAPSSNSRDAHEQLEHFQYDEEGELYRAGKAIFLYAGNTVDGRAVFGWETAGTVNVTLVPPVDPSKRCRHPFGDKTRIVCDNEWMREFPIAQKAWNLTLFKLNNTMIRSLPEYAFSGHSIEVVIIEDNWLLSAIDQEAFTDLKGTQYLRFKDNSLNWDDDHRGLTSRRSFFEYFSDLTSLQTLLFEYNRLNLTQTMWSPSIFEGLLGSGHDSRPILPCLQELSFQGNPLTHILKDFFEPLRRSPLKRLNLRKGPDKNEKRYKSHKGHKMAPNFMTQIEAKGCDLLFIEEDAFRPLRELRELDLFNNFKLFQLDLSDYLAPNSESPYRSIAHFLFDIGIVEIDFGSNVMTEVPYDALEMVNSTLKSLVLSENVFVELGSGGIFFKGRNTFPRMPRLKSLYLDSCRIQKIHHTTFENLPRLETLSLQDNYLFTVPSGVMLPSLRTLSFKCGDSMLAIDKQFRIPDRIFERYEEMSRLRTLTFSDCNMKTLKSDMFKGLEKLKTLAFSNCNLQGIESGAFEHLRSVSNLSLASCTGIQKLPGPSLSGPMNLEVVDLSNILLSVEDFGMTGLLGGEEESMATSQTRILNLTGSLLNMGSPMSLLQLQYMPELEVLDISRNRFTYWDSPKFSENGKLGSVMLTWNHDYINLTEAMVQDFTNLTYLDLTDNEFLCTPGVASFVSMAAEQENSLEIKNFHYGYGYNCRDEEWKTVTFRDYSEEYMNQVIEEPPSPVMARYGRLVGLLMAMLLIVGAIFFASYRIYANRWYFQYIIARRQVRRKTEKASRFGNSSPSIQYDAFVSFNGTDSDFVQDVIISGLEGRHPKLRLCHHERDFQVGRSIFENIVEALSSSRYCILVLSAHYAQSEWCKFEAQMALRIFQEQQESEDQKAIIVVVRNKVSGDSIDKSLRTIIKLRTYLQWHDPPNGKAASEKALESFHRRLRYAMNYKLSADDT